MEGAAAKNERDSQDVHFVQSGLDKTGLSLNNISRYVKSAQYKKLAPNDLLFTY